MKRDSHTAWHALSPDEVTRRLDIDAAHGLIADEASRRLDAHGPNRLAERRRGRRGSSLSTSSAAC